MQAGQRDLGGAGEEELVLGDLVDLVAVAGQEAGPVQRLLADQDRRHDRLVALAADQLDREADQGQLEQDQVALQVGEARAREPRRRPPCRSAPARCRSRGGRAARSRSSGRSPTSRRTTASSSVIPSGASGSGRLGSVARDPLELGLDLLQLGLAGLDPSPSAPATLGDQLLGVLARAASPRRSAWRASCARPGRPRSRGSSSRRRASSASSSSTALGGAAAGQRRLDPLGVGADQLQVEHRRRRAQGDGFAGARRFLGFVCPAYSATKRATASASSPTTMFWGMIAPEKPPFWIAKRASS